MFEDLCLWRYIYIYIYGEKSSGYNITIHIQFCDILIDIILVNLLNDIQETYLTTLKW